MTHCVMPVIPVTTRKKDKKGKKAQADMTADLRIKRICLKIRFIL